MPEITIGSGGGNAEAGVYVLTLKSVGEPHMVTMPENSPFGSGDIMMMDWVWTLPNGEDVRESTTMASGPKSKFFARVVALNNGRAPMLGEKVNTDNYIGRRVIGTITIKESGYPKIVSVSAMPLEMQQQAFAQATGAPVAVAAPQQLHPQPQQLAPSHPQAQPPVVSPLRAQAAAPADDLPF